jgi:hypothetical protein
MSFDAAVMDRLIRESGIEFRETGQSFKFDCPRCQKKEKLYIRKKDGRFRCFYCVTTENFQGRAEYALTELLSASLRDLRLKLYGNDVPEQVQYLELELEDPWGEDEDEFSFDVAPVIKEICWPPDFVGMDQPESFVKGARYLHGRGITPEHVEVYDIKFSPVDQRVIFPVKIDDKLIGWQARYIGITERYDEDLQRWIRIPKILTSDSLRDTGNRYLMFQDRLKGSEHCVLAEGPVSAIKAHLCGGNVAAMGKGVSKLQMQTITRMCRKLYIALDPDAGEDIARLAHEYSDDLEIYLLQPPSKYEDLGDAPQEEVYEAFKTATPEPRGKLYISLGGALYS